MGHAHTHLLSAWERYLLRERMKTLYRQEESILIREICDADYCLPAARAAITIEQLEEYQKYHEAGLSAEAKGLVMKEHA